MALARLLEGVSRNELARRSAAISAHYRAGRGSLAAVRDRLDALAYAVARMPATQAAAAEALTRLKEAAPDFAPRGLLDLGAGCGAATLAALETFPTLARAILVDRNAAMLELARELLAQESAEIGALALDLRRLEEAGEADLVTMAYVLVEMDVQEALALARRVFGRARGGLVLIEPGTPAGFERLRAVRAALIEDGAQIAAPCPHHLACPIAPPDWRHFSVRVQRRRDHLTVKAAEAPFEDEPFIYLAAARAPPARRAARVIARPVRAKMGLTARLCGLDGAAREVVVPVRDKAATRAVRRLEEGDMWPL
jgi:ribosomal protein RSM22 (predicted rRNA methylase)